MNPLDSGLLHGRTYVTLGLRPYYLGRFRENRRVVEFISWPYPAERGASIMIRNPGDPTTLRSAPLTCLEPLGKPCLERAE